MAKKQTTRRGNPSEMDAVIVSPSRKVVTISSLQDLPTLYANNANVEATNWDVRIRLGQVQVATSEEVQVKDIIAIYMSHEHAKAFSDSLAGVVAKLTEVKQQLVAKARADTKHG